MSRLRLPRFLSEAPSRRSFVWVLPRTVDRVEGIRRWLHKRRATGWQFDGVTAVELASVTQRSYGVVVWSGEYRLDALLSYYYEFIGSSLRTWSYRSPEHRVRFSINRYDTLVFVPMSSGKNRIPVMVWVVNRCA